MGVRRPVACCFVPHAHTSFHNLLNTLFPGRSTTKVPRGNLSSSACSHTISVTHAPQVPSTGRLSPLGCHFLFGRARPIGRRQRLSGRFGALPAQAERAEKGGGCAARSLHHR